MGCGARKSRFGGLGLRHACLPLVCKLPPDHVPQHIPLALCCVQVLSSSEGNILEDATAVQILSEAKQVSDDITAKQAVAEETQERIDAARRGYRPCGEYNAALFFCIADLAGVDAMYQVGDMGRCGEYTGVLLLFCC